eukprot:2223565-Rhodomonas_salina.4
MSVPGIASRARRPRAELTCRHDWNENFLIAPYATSVSDMVWHARCSELLQPSGRRIADVRTAFRMANAQDTGGCDPEGSWMMTASHLKNVQPLSVPDIV